MLRRRADLMIDYVDLWRGKAFDWRDAHCALFAGRWVKTIEGVDPMKGVPELPHGIAAARFLQREYGSLADAVTQRLARASIDWKLATIGDVVLFPGELVGALGLCNGRTAFCLFPSGVDSRDMNEALCAWRVG